MKIEVYSPTIRRKEMDAVLTAMVEDRIGPGEGARLLVSTAKEYLRFDYALCVRSPAIALELALKALNPHKGQSVAISALSPRYYTRVIEDLGLSPLYCDVSLTFPCMSRETIEQALQRRMNRLPDSPPEPQSPPDPQSTTEPQSPPDPQLPTDLQSTPDSVLCIVLHHTLGYTPDLASISELGLPVIEDVSQSFYGFSGGKTDAVKPETEAPKELTHGLFTILGMEERDMLTAGGGALLYANNRKDSAALRNYGDLPGEYCMPDINAALAIVQFKEARRNAEKRAVIAQAFIQSSLRTRHKRFVQAEETEYSNFAFPLVLETGLKDVLAYARKKEIILESAFDNTIAGISAGVHAGDVLGCPASYSLSLRTVLFPLYPRLRSSEIERVAKLIVTIP